MLLAADTLRDRPNFGDTVDILTIATSVFRRWYLTFPVMLAAIGIALYVNSTIPPQYQAQGQILLASPDLDPSGLPRSFVDVAELAGELTTDAVGGPLVVGSASIDVSAGLESLDLVVTSDSAEDSRATVDNIVAWLETQVEERQVAAGFDPAERVRLQTATQEVTDNEAGTVQDDSAGETSDANDETTLSTTIRLDDPAARVVNPFGASGQTARILTVAVQSDEGRTAVAERTGPEVEFTLGQQARDAAPILTITTMGPVPEVVLGAFEHVSDEVAASLSEREERAEVPPTRRTRVEPIAAPQTVTDVSPPLDRAVAAIIGLGGLLAIALAIIADSITSGSWARREDADTQVSGHSELPDRDGGYTPWTDRDATTQSGLPQARSKFGRAGSR